MRLNYRVERFHFGNGEDCSMLQDSFGMPMDLPSLYAMKNLRKKGDAANTIHNKLSALSVLYTWFDCKGIDINLRFSKGEFLDDMELEDLMAFCTKNFSLKSASEITKIVARKIVQHPRKKMKIATMRTTETPSVGSSTCYARMTSIGPYLEWLATRAAKKSQQWVDEDTKRTIKDMVDYFLDSRPPKNSKEYEPKSLTIEEREAVIKYFDINSPYNPFAEEDVRVRNQVIFALLMHHGLRVGEMLGIKMKDISLGDGKLIIHRRPHDMDDSRTIKAHQKTTAREFYMEPELVALLQKYIIKYRKKAKNNNSPYLLLSHHAGKCKKGSPLSKSSINKLFATVKSVSNDLPEHLHPHMLRHTWACMFCERLDSVQGEDKYSEEEIIVLLCDQAGWAVDSPMAKYYSKRYIRKKSGEASKTYQKTLTSEAIKESQESRGK